MVNNPSERSVSAFGTSIFVIVNQIKSLKECTRTLYVYLMNSIYCISLVSIYCNYYFFLWPLHWKKSQNCENKHVSFRWDELWVICDFTCMLHSIMVEECTVQVIDRKTTCLLYKEQMLFFILAQIWNNPWDKVPVLARWREKIQSRIVQISNSAIHHVYELLKRRVNIGIWFLSRLCPWMEEKKTFWYWHNYQHRVEGDSDMKLQQKSGRLSMVAERWSGVIVKA